MNTQLVQPNQLSAISRQLQEGRLAGLLVFASSKHCPWCGLVSNDQLLPRLRTPGLAKIAIVEFDINDATTLTSAGNPHSEGLRLPSNVSPLAWAKAHNIRVVPTITAVNRQLTPLRTPLVGYSSADFYGAYLEEQITEAVNYWAKAR